MWRSLRLPAGLFSILGSLLISSSALAGLIELEAGVLYRTSRIDSDNYQESTSYTGSLSYYFWEMSAIEFSYTQGISKLSIKASESDPKQVYKTEYQMFGADFVFSFADRKAPLQPYIKVGGAQMTKKIFQETDAGGRILIGDSKGVVPSAGLGFKLKLTKTFSIKMGVDAWQNTSDDKDDVPIDYAGRAGIVWLF